MVEAFEQIARDLDYKAPSLSFLLDLAERRTSAVELGEATEAFRRLAPARMPAKWRLVRNQRPSARWGHGCICDRDCYDVLDTEAGVRVNRGWYCAKHDSWFWE